MCKVRHLVVLVGLLLSPAWSAWGQAISPTERYSELSSLTELSVEQLPAVEIPAETQSSGSAITPYRYGVVVDASFSPSSHGTWETVGETWIWRFRLRSAEARSLSLAFSGLSLPPSARLSVRDPDGNLVHGPYTQGDPRNGRHRTPLVRGNEIVVELQVAASERKRVELTISDVVHGYRTILPRLRGEVPSKDGACNVDVVCPEGDPWFPLYRSVGSYTYVENGSSFVCTGSLVNTTADDGPPLFLTAEHCISTPEIAETMVFYWNYQSPTCRTQGSPENADEPNDDRLDQTSSGAILRARYGNAHRQGTISGRPDLAVVEVDDALPESYGLYFAGWDRSGTPPDRGVTVHHPQGDAKRISFDNDPIIRTAYAELTPDPDGTHWLIEAWELGTTEGGSSGAPLYNGNQRIVGVLSGGLAACTAGGDEDNDEPDWYGSLAAGYNEGDYNGVLISDVLDPSNTGVSSLPGRSQNPDPAPPGPITDFSTADVTSSRVTLTWIAPGDDGASGTAQSYDFRVRTGEPIVTEDDFFDARRIGDVPAPDVAGTQQRTSVSVDSDSTYYFAIQAIDDVGKRSPLTILSAEDGSELGVAPVENLRVQGPFPNPVRSRAEIEFSSPVDGTARIEVYDALGRVVQQPAPRDVRANRPNTLVLNAEALSAGMYFVRFRVDGEQVVVRAAVVR